MQLSVSVDYNITEKYTHTVFLECVTEIAIFLYKILWFHLVYVPQNLLFMYMSEIFVHRNSYLELMYSCKMESIIYALVYMTHCGR